MKLDNANLNLGGGEIVLRKTAVENAGGKKITDTYAEHAKLVFLFDESSSMFARVAHDKSGKSYADQFIWPPEMLTVIRSKVAAAITSAMISEAGGTPAVMSLSPEELDAFRLRDETFDPAVGYTFTASDEELKDRIIKNDLMDAFGILPDIFSKTHQQPPTRIQLVQKLAKQEIANRFKKFPKSRVAIIPFNYEPKVLFDDGDPSEVDKHLDQLEKMCGGGTDIMKAISKGMEVCRKKPSAVGIHHFILITDGEDRTVSVNIMDWLPAMKASGIVLDYIHIGEAGYRNAALERACKELGGDFVIVNSEKEMEEKFVQAINRACLPPASAVK